MANDPVLCPLKLVEVRPFCDYPGIGKVLAQAGVTGDQLETLRVSMHIFEHKLLAAGYEFYERVPRPLGEKLLRAFLLTVAAELKKEVELSKPKK